MKAIENGCGVVPARGPLPLIPGNAGIKALPMSSEMVKAIDRARTAAVTLKSAAVVVSWDHAGYQGTTENLIKRFIERVEARGDQFTGKVIYREAVQA
jgi:hypothetical protein